MIGQTNRQTEITTLYICSISTSKKIKCYKLMTYDFIVFYITTFLKSKSKLNAPFNLFFLVPIEVFI